MKRKLLLAALCVVGALGFKANAQTWTPSEVGAGSFYIYNVGAKGYIVAGNNWGSRASINAQGGILTTLALNNGAYTISTAPTYSGKYLGTDGYVDQGSYAWTFEPVAGEANVYKMKHSDGKYLFADAGATTTSIGSDPGTDYAKWKLVTRANRIADLEANASSDNPIDATFLLTNPNFDRNSTTSMWTGGVSLGGNNENYCAEKFNTNFDVYQTVTDAPKGAYALAFQGFYRYGGHGITPAGDARKNSTEVLNTKLYANDTEAPLMSILDETTAGGGSTYDGVAYPNSMAEASTAFSNGLYSTSMDFTVDVNTIKIGVKKTVTVTNDWTIFDNARLTYYGPVVDFTIYETNLQTQVNNAEELYGKLPTAAETNLKAIVDQYNKEYDNVDDYIEAIAAIKDAVETATPIVEPYADFNALKAQADALVAVENTNSEANGTLSTAISTQTTAADNATTVAALTTAYNTLKTAMITYAGAADPTSGNRFDLTFMVVNPDLSGFDAWTKVDAVDGWYTEQNEEGQNPQVMKNDGVACAEGNAFFEYWSPNAVANGNFALYNKVENLPAGTFTIDCYALATANGVEGATTSAIYFYANDTQGSLVSADVLTAASISFINDEEQDVKIGLKPLTGNQFRWMGIGYVKLYKEYTDNSTYDITADVANGSVAVTVDGVAATSAKALKTVTLTYTPDEGYAVSSVIATYNDGTNDVNLDVANPSANVYTFQMPAYDVTVTSTLVVDKTELAAAITAASALNTTANVGDGVFQKSATLASALASALSDAQTVNSNAAATPTEVSEATTALTTATNNFNNAGLNAPDASKRYKLTLANKGALTFRTAETEGGYGMPFMTAADYLAQTFTLTPVAGKVDTYTLSFKDLEGNTRYVCTRAQYGEGGTGTSGIRTFAEGETGKAALEIKIQASETNGVFYMLNTEANNAKLGAQNNGDFYTVNDNSDWSIAEASQASVIVSAKAGKYGTTILPFTPDVSTGFDNITFYSIAGITNAGNAYIEKVETPAANVPYLIKNDDTEFSKELTGWGTAAATSYTAGLLTGVYEAATIPVNSYVLQTQGGKQAFYQVNSENYPAAAYKAYLTASSATAKERISLSFDGEATAINALEVLTSGEYDAIYNAAGAKVDALQKGVNIIKKGDKTYKIFVK